MSDAISVIETAYRTDLDDAAWLQAVLEASRSELDSGFGIFGFYLDAQDLSAIRVHAPTIVGGPAGSDSVLSEISCALQLGVDEQRALGILGPRESAEAIYARSHAIVTATEIAGAAAWSSNPAVTRWLQPFGIVDLLAIKTVDLDRRGFLIGAPTSRVAPPAPRTCALWARLVSHVSSAYRLRRTLANGSPARSVMEGADAILEADGRVVDARGAAATLDGRDALRAMAIAMDRARSSLRKSDEEEAISLWTALVDGRWTLLEHFDRDGRRYFVARRNEPQVHEVLALGPRERQIVAYAARGHSVKLIAYELGLSSPTISEHLTSAMAKLGVANRGELSRVFATASDVTERGLAPIGVEDVAVTGADVVRSGDARVLTDTERAIVTLVLDGATNAAIATHRGTSVRTVANQVARVFKKLRVGSRAELAAWAAGARA